MTQSMSLTADMLDWLVRIVPEDEYNIVEMIHDAANRPDMKLSEMSMAVAALLEDLPDVQARWFEKCNESYRAIVARIRDCVEVRFVEKGVVAREVPSMELFDIGILHCETPRDMVIFAHNWSMWMVRMFHGVTSTYDVFALRDQMLSGTDVERRFITQVMNLWQFSQLPKSTVEDIENAIY